MADRKLFVALEGPIGVGKSTAAATIARIVDYDLYKEPLDGDIAEVRELFYNDKSRWAFPFQIKLFQRRFRQHQRIVNDLDSRGAIQDRSIYGDKSFAYMLWRAGHISNQEIRIYEEQWQVMRQFLVQPDVMIYLDAPVDILMDRIHGERKRDEESGIQPSYLNELNSYIDTSYEEMRNMGVSCYRLDWKDPNSHLTDILAYIRIHENRSVNPYRRLR